MKKNVIMILFLALLQGLHAQGLRDILKVMPDTIIPTITADSRNAMIDEALRFGMGQGLTLLEKEVTAQAVTSDEITFTIDNAAKFDFILLPSSYKDTDSVTCVISTFNYENKDAHVFTPFSMVRVYDSEWNCIGSQKFDITNFVARSSQFSDEQCSELLKKVELSFAVVDYNPDSNSITLSFSFPLNDADEVAQLKQILPPTTLMWNGKQFEKPM